MTAKDDAFLSRWSRLKRRGGEPDPVPAAAPAAADPVPAAPDPAAALTLDDVAALKPDADFRPFLAAAATEAVHRAALRKLWASDPIITTHDGLTDYAEDYTFKADVAEQVRTAWRGGVDAWEQASGVDEKETAQDAGNVAVDDRYAQQSITDQKSEKSDDVIPDREAEPFAGA
jgi:hypothetical protein